MKTVLSKENIRQVAGQTFFDQGLLLSSQVAIENFDLQSGQASGRITGGAGKSGRVTLRFTDQQLEGQCDCPESEGFEFCPHCVVLALYTEKQLRKIQVLRKGTDQDKILGYLLGLEKTQLASITLNFIKQEPSLISQFLLKANMGGGQVDYAAVKKQITDLTRLPERLFTQKQIQNFFQQIETFSLALLSMELAADPAKLLKLVDYLFDRLSAALAKMEDSQKHHLAVTELLAPLALRLRQKQTPKITALASLLFKLWLEDGQDLKRLSPDWITPRLPEPEQAVFRHTFEQLCDREWQSLPSHTPQALQALDDDTRLSTITRYSKLRAVLLASENARTNAETRLAIRSKLIERPSEYLSLARTAKEAGQTELSIQWYQQYLETAPPSNTPSPSNGHNAFEGDIPVKNLPLIALHELCALLKAEHRGEEALPYLWRSFEIQPNPDDFNALVHISAKQGPEQRDAVHPKALGLVQQWLSHQKDSIPFSGWQALVLLAPDAALKLTASLGGGPQLDSKALGYLAERLADTVAATALFQSAIEQAIKKGTAASYQEVESYLQGLQQTLCPTDFDQYLKALHHEHRHKRSLKEKLRPFLAAS